MTSNLVIDVSCPVGGWPDHVIDIVKNAAQIAWAVEGGADQQRIGELSLVLADDTMVQELNNKWRGKDKPTNVLSFPADDFDIPDAPRLLGDVILALETVEREAVAQNKVFDHHLTHLVIHGVLHLLGFDHIEEDEADIMEAMEVKLLAEVNIANPYILGGIREEEFIKNG